MITLYNLIWQLLSLYTYLLIGNVIFSWLYAFRIINPHNSIVAMVGEFLYRFTEPSLRIARRIAPNMGSIDLSPMIVFLFIWFIQSLMAEYLWPLIAY